MACSHQASASMLLQLCYDTNDTVLIDNNGVTRKWDATPFWSDSLVFNENTIVSIIAELTDAWCKWALRQVAPYLLPVCDVLESPEEEDALPLRFGNRLHYPRLSWVLLKLLHEYVVLRLKLKIKPNSTMLTTCSTKTSSTSVL